MRMQRLLIGSICLGVAALLIGCQPTAPTPPPPQPGPPGGPPGGGTPAAFDADSEPNAAGKKVMVASGCFRCHAVNGARAGGPPGFSPSGGPPGFPPGGAPPGAPPGAPQGAPPGAPPGGPPGGPPGPGGYGRGGPDLGKVAKDEAHTVDWFMAFIRDPKSKKADARMPAFDKEKIKDDDLRALAEYLATLK